MEVEEIERLREELRQEQVQNDSCRHALMEYTNRITHLEEQLKRVVKVPDYVTNIRSHEEFIEIAQNVETELCELHEENHGLRNRCRALLLLGETVKCNEQPLTSVSSSSTLNEAMIIHSQYTTNPSEGSQNEKQKNYEEEIAKLKEKLNEKESAIEEMKRQRDEREEQKENEPEVPIDTELRAFEPSKKLREKIAELSSDPELLAAAKAHLRMLEGEGADAPTNALNDSLVHLHEMTNYAMNDAERAFERLQGMREAMQSMFNRLKTSAGLFEEILAAIGEQSDLAERIKQLSLEFSFGEQGPPDLLQLIIEAEKSMAAVHESLHKINQSVLIQSSFAIDVSKHSSFRVDNPSTLNMFGEMRVGDMEDVNSNVSTGTEENLCRLLAEKDQVCQFLETQCSMTKDNVNELKANVSKLTAQLISKSEELKAKENKIADLQKEVNQKLERYVPIEEHEKQKAKFVAIELEMRTAKQEIERIAEEKEIEVLKMREEEQGIRKEMDQLARQAETSKEKLDSAISQLDSMREGLGKIELEMERKTNESNRLAHEVQQVKKELAASDKRRKELAEEIEAVNEKYEATKRQLEERQRKEITAETLVQMSEDNSLAINGHSRQPAVASLCPSATLTIPSVNYSLDTIIPVGSSVSSTQPHQQLSAGCAHESVTTRNLSSAFLVESTTKVDDVVQEIKKLVKDYNEQRFDEAVERTKALLDTCRDLRAFMNERLKATREEDKLGRTDRDEIITKTLDLISKNNYLEEKVTHLEAEAKNKLMGLKPRIKQELHNIENVMRGVEENVHGYRHEQGNAGATTD